MSAFWLNYAGFVPEVPNESALNKTVTSKMMTNIEL